MPPTTVSTPQHSQQQPRREVPAAAHTIVRALGWFSVGLGAAELLGSRELARIIGFADTRRSKRTIIALGARELATGLGLLQSKQATPWLWMRLLGDVTDLSLLARSTRVPRSQHRTRLEDALVRALAPKLAPKRVDNLGTALALVGIVTAVDAYAMRYLARGQALRFTHAQTGKRATTPRRISRSVTIARAPDDVFGFWRDLSNLPRFMTHLESVEELDGERSRWVARGPGGARVTWNARIVDERPGELLQWESQPGSDVHHSGTIRFVPAPGGRGCEVHVQMRHGIPGGRVGLAFAKLVGRDPVQQLTGDLSRLKQVLETGHVVQSDASTHRGPHPARPAKSRANERQRQAPPASVQTPATGQPRSSETSEVQP